MDTANKINMITSNDLNQKLTRNNNINKFNTFDELNLPQTLLQTLVKLNFKEPTPIQQKTIPLALENHDILGSANTGTGKTLAFIIPLITNLINNPKNNALILTPTRELAEQVISVVQKILGFKSTIKSVLLIGGEPIFKQLKQLKLHPRIIVGTPGRVIDHLSRKTLNPNFNFLVLDETDRMLDMGFGIQLEQIVHQLPKNRQTLMFSATLSKYIENLANKYLNQPKRIAIESTNNSIINLQEETIRVEGSQKFSTLLNQIEKRTGTIIIFVKTKNGAEVLSKDLYKKNYKVSYMHGDLKQHKRSKVINDFRNGHYQIMVATDIAARGIDVPHIEHVINYDLPNSPEDYIHRIGRTARAGAKGSALNLICNQDQAKWAVIQRFINPKTASSARNNTPSSNHNFKFKQNNSKFKFKSNTNNTTTTKPNSTGNKFKTNSRSNYNSSNNSNNKNSTNYRTNFRSTNFKSNSQFK